MSSLVADLGELTESDAPPRAAGPAHAPGEPAPVGAGGAPPEPPGPAPATAAPDPTQSLAGTPPLRGDPEGTLELEDLPSYSPSYLPPLPPPVGEPMMPDLAGRRSPPGPEPHASGEWLAAALAAGAIGPREASGRRRPTPPPEEWPAPEDPAPARLSAAPPPSPAPGGASDWGAGPASPDLPATRMDTDPDELGGPGWHVAARPATARPPADAGYLEPEPETDLTPGSAERREPATQGEADDGQRFRASPPSAPEPPAEQLEPALAAASTRPSGSVSGPTPGSPRLGLPLLPGGLPAPVSTRPWSLAAAMTPLPPLAPTPGRSVVLPVEPVGPGAAPLGDPGDGVSLRLLVGIAIVLVVLITVLVVVRLHH